MLIIVINYFSAYLICGSRGLVRGEKLLVNLIDFVEVLKNIHDQKLPV